MTMSYIVFKPPPLQHIVLVRICAELWTQRDIWSELQKVLPDYVSVSLVSGSHVFPVRLQPTSPDVANKVREKISALRLPELLRKLVLEFSKCVGLEFDRWLDKHRAGKEILFQEHFPERLFWTTRGCIDYKKTAELLVKDENLSLRDRYQIACINCLEEDIRRLIQRMPEDEIKALIATPKNALEMMNETLMVYWACKLNGVARKDIFIRKSGHSLYQNAYYNATLVHNQAASSYFLEKLNQRQKDKVFVEPKLYLCGPSFEFWNEIIFYLSEDSRVSEVKQETFVQRYPAEILNCFLDWQWQTMFMEIVKRLWRFMNLRHYACLMHYLSGKIRHSFHEYRYFDSMYAEIYQELYLLSPTYYKNYLLNDYTATWLFETERNELMALILNGASELQKQRLNNNSRDCRIGIISILMDDSMVSKETLILCQKKFELEWVGLSERDEKGQLTRPSAGKHLLSLMANCMVELSKIGTGIICNSLMSADDFKI